MGNPTVTGSASDLLLKSRLEGLGYDVALMDDNAIDRTAADSGDLIVVSESVKSNLIGTRFNSTTTPLIALEAFVYDDLHLTPTGNTVGYGITSGIDLKQGSATVDVYNRANKIGWGDVTDDAMVLATLPGDTNKATAFAYGVGDTLANGSTSRNNWGGFFAHNDGVDNLTPAGWQLFEQVVNQVTA
ncbi:MAG: hypothetical protein AAGD25_12840 [Cyanobacteria bacterium P01_F01_bin.150]